MPKADLGTKHTCESCGAKFYDMKKQPAVCPSCGTTVELETKRKTRAPKPEEPAKRKPAVVKDEESEEEVDDEIEDLDDDDAADPLLEEDEEDDDEDIGVGIGEESEEE